MNNLHKIVTDLRALAAETGQLSAGCLGCGYEHDCSVHGCALIHAAADSLEQSETAWQQLTNQLRVSEEARTDLAKRLAAAEKGGKGETV